MRPPTWSVVLAVVAATARQSAERVAATAAHGAPVATVAVTGAPATATMTAVHDRWILRKLRSEFFANAHLRDQNIHLRVYRGVVTLSGRVRDHYAKLAAEQIAHDTAGVIRVVNRLQSPAAQ